MKDQSIIFIIGLSLFLVAFGLFLKLYPHQSKYSQPSMSQSDMDKKIKEEIKNLRDKEKSFQDDTKQKLQDMRDRHF